MSPTPGHNQGIVGPLGAETAKTKEDLPDVTQIEEVVGLRWRGQQVVQCLLEYIDGGIDHGWEQLLHTFIEDCEEILGDHIENVFDGHIRQVRVRRRAVVPLESLCDESSSTAGRSHGRNHDHINDVELHKLLPVVPTSVIMPLSDKLDRRLCPVVLLERHVQVIYKQHHLLPCRWSIDSASPLLKLRVDQVLQLVHVRLS
mmetsp:Transcript_51844/g.121547  ORF Transcript_51844/g.121547 Transcript_51844/m.121547 type:complete len:201 (+) Transcript_51844:5001-5603(+)